MRVKSNCIYYLLVTLLFVYGCSNTKHLPEGDMLYVGGEVNIEDSIMDKSDRKDLEAELEDLMRPKPNRKILGLRAKLYFYNLAGEPKKDKGFRYWLRNKVGEPPVLMSQVDLDYNADVLTSHTENNGYFKARTSADSTSKNRRARAEYTVTPGRQYRIRNVTYPSDSTKLDSAISIIKPFSRLKRGMAYDLDLIKEERELIDKILKQKGYYYFNPDFILVQVDSTVGDHKVDLNVKIKEETPARSKEVYTIDDIIVFSNYSIENAAKNDTITFAGVSAQKYKDFTIVDPENTFRPIIYDHTLFFHTGDIYNRRDHNLSLNRLVNLGTFKFVKNEFKLADTISNKLDAYYYLTPLPRKSIRFEILAKTNSANYNGTELNVNWSNRNTFRAAELLNISVFGGLEVQVAGQNQGFNVYRIGTETSLTWPRFITPIHIADSSAFVPRTRALVSYEYQNRARLYSLNSFRGQFGYLWKNDIKTEHQLTPFDINYVNSTNVTDLYQTQIDSFPALERVIEKQLIVGPTYSYTFTNTMQRYRKNTFYYKGSMDAVGTLAGLFTGANIKEGDTVRILNVPFSQFLKTDHDFRHYYRLGRNSQIASRLMVGVGMPYGNSDQLPFMRQFFIGGTNSIRAFRARSIGPGTFKNDVDENTFLPDESGDIRLEINTEYRAKLFSVVHGALFVDAGNIWLWNESEDKPGGKFSKDFLKELAVGTGVGLRFDLSFLILRTDLAFPIRKPWLQENDRWVFDDINFGSSTWRRENLVFNLAIGYPF